MTYCVFCGAALADAHRCHQCGAYKVGESWNEGGAPDPTTGTGTADGGWRPDPTGRHEGRYFAAGQPTDLVRDGGFESIDPVGKQQLADAGGVDRGGIPDTAPGSRLWIKWVVGSVVLVLLLAGAGTAAALYFTRDRETVDDKYLAALREADLTGEFNSDANAVAHGKQVCRRLDEGAPQQGMPVDEVAVQFYCPQFVQGFHVLETALITGSFTIKDDSPGYSPLIDTAGPSCTGSNGYSDIGPGVQVMVKNGKGEILTTTVLESGEGGQFSCTFPFSFEATEGQDRYIVSVTDRGELDFSFNDMTTRGVTLVLGGS